MIKDKYQITALDIAEALARIESLLIMLCEFVEDTPEGPVLCVSPVRVSKTPSSPLGDALVAMMRKKKAEGDT